MWRRAFTMILLAFLAGSVFIQPALGKQYPAKPVGILCPSNPGSIIDILTGLIADVSRFILCFNGLCVIPKTQI